MSPARHTYGIGGMLLTDLQGIEEALAALGSARETTEELRQAFDLARKAYFVALHKYSVGSSDVEPVYQAEHHLLVMEYHLKAAEAEQARVLANLYQLLFSSSCSNENSREFGKPERLTI